MYNERFIRNYLLSLDVDYPGGWKTSYFTPRSYVLRTYLSVYNWPLEIVWRSVGVRLVSLTEFTPYVIIKSKKVG